MKRFLLILSALFVLLGCQDAQVEESMQELEVEVSELKLDYRAQEVVIALRTNQTIEVEVAVNWIVHTVAEGGDGVELYLLENRGANPRSAEVVIKAGDLSHTVTIYQGIKPECMGLTLSHTSTHLDSPAWGGSDIKGVVNWGDGTTEEYSEGVSHEYTDAQKRSARFSMEGATSFRIERIGDIEGVTILL